MPRFSTAEIEQLSIAERVQLAEDIWDSIAAAPEMLPVTEAQRAELDRRLALLGQDPSRTVPWDEVRSKLSQAR
jgi:putative addiction module component (TIGR02574 family)